MSGPPIVSATMAGIDADQVIRSAGVKLSNGQTALATTPIGGALVPDSYDEIALTYIAVGNGTGQIGTVVYKLAGATIATLTLTYNSGNQLIDVLRS